MEKPKHPIPEHVMEIHHGENSEREEKETQSSTGRTINPLILNKCFQAGSFGNPALERSSSNSSIINVAPAVRLAEGDNNSNKRN